MVISAKYRIVMYEGENYTELNTLPTGFKLQCDLSTVEFTQGYVWLDNSVEYTDQTNVNIRLLKGDNILDSRSFPVTIQASATFEITDDIQA